MKGKAESLNFFRMFKKESILTKLVTWFLTFLLVFNDIGFYIKSLVFLFSVSNVYALEVNLPQPRIVDPQCNPVRDPTVSQHNQMITPTFRAEIDSCVYTPSGGTSVCAEGYFFDRGLGVCKKSPPDCPSDGVFIYSFTTKKCEEKIAAPVLQNGTELNICKERCYDLRIDAKIEGLVGNSTSSNSTNGTCLVPPNLLTNSILAYLIVFTLYKSNFTYNSTPFFVDVSSTHPHFRYIQKIRQDNIMLGFPLYCVDKLLSREELYAFVVRYLLNGQDPAPGTYSTSPYFPDVTSSVTGLFPHIQKAYELGLIYGTQPGSNFYPLSQPSTREIYEVLKKVNVNVLPKICSLLNVANCNENILSNSPGNFTRGQFAFLMVSSIWGENFSYRLLSYFDDVQEDHPYFKYVQKLAELRITRGCEKYRFYPDKFLIREKLYEAAVRYKLGGTEPSPGTYSEQPYFPDVTNETVRGFSYIQKAEELGLVVHTTVGSDFRPYEQVTLQEVVEVFERVGLNLRDTVCQFGGSIFVPVPVRCEEDGEGLYLFDTVSGKCVSLFSFDKFPYYQVAYLYNRVLNRSPEGKGYAYWIKTNPCFQGEYSLSCLEYYVKAAVETLDRVGYDAPCGIDLRTKPCHSVTDETGMPLSVKIMAALIASLGTCPSSSTFDSYCNNKTVPIVNNVIIPQPGNFTNRLCPIPDYLVRNFGVNALLSGNLTQTFSFRIESDLKCSYVPRCDDGSYPRLVDGIYTCGEVLSYSNTAIPMTYDWSSKDGTKKVTVKMKKGIFIEGILRAYGDGCFIQSYDLVLCVSGGGSKLRFSFKHPEKGFQDLEVSLRPKWYNEFTAFITPEMVGLSVKDTGSGYTEFKEAKLGYAPVDKDDPSRVMTIDLTLTPLRTNSLEVVVLKFYTYGQTSPFCPDNGVAYCSGNNAIVNIQQQGVRVTSGTSTPSATNYCTPAMISVRFERGGEKDGMVYSFNFNGTIEENINNIGDMLRYSSDSKVSAGLCLYWKTTDNMTGFIQKLNRNNYVESYGYMFDFISGSTPIPKQMGVYRVSNDFVGNIYFGRESNRNSTWISYSLPVGFYSPSNIELREPRSNEVLTDDGYFEKFADLCPTGQVELYGQIVYPPYGTDLGTGKCFTYVEPADCYHSSMNGYDIDKFGNMCDLQVGVPDQCPSGTYLLTPYTSPSDDYKCEYRQSPTCPSWTIRIGGSCYEYVSPSTSYCQQNCGSTCSCSYSGSGLCNCNYSYSSMYLASYLSSSVTRAQFAVMYIRAKYGDSFSYNSSPYFTDVPISHSYFKYIQRFRQDGLTTGCTSSTYCPDDLLRRFELYIFLIRHYIGDYFSYSSTPCYPDVTPSSVGETVFKYIQKACELNLVVGTQPGQNFNPYSYTYINEVNQAFSRVGLSLGYYVCPLVNSCVLDYMLYNYYCYYTCSGQKTVSACPSGYSYDSSRGICIKYYNSACPSSYAYDSSRDICYYREDARCLRGTRKCCDPESPGGRYSGCYETNSYVGPYTQYPSDRTGKIYCRNGLVFYKDRCYRYNDIACNRTYSEDLVILGSANSFGEWTGTCWQKTAEGCQGGYIIRKPHVVGSSISTNTCAVLKQKVDFTSELTTQSSIDDFQRVLLQYFRKNLFGINTLDSNSLKLSFYPYSSIIGMRGFFEEPSKYFCPLDPNIACAPFAGNVYLCANSENFCAICTEGIPPKARDNAAFASIYRIREYPDKVYGLFRFQYNYLGAYDMTKAIEGARLPKKSEFSLISSLFNIKSFWTEETVSSETDLEKMDNLVLVMSKDNFGFLAECLFGDDMNMICAADMVKCNGDKCPLGNYTCIPIKGVKYCSKYSTICKSLADPAGWEGLEDEYDPDPETESPGEIDDEQGCLGQVSIFSGTALRCRPQGLYTGPRNCCDDDLVDEDEIPKDNFGGTPGAMLQFGLSLSLSAITSIGQFMYRLYDIYKSGAQSVVLQIGTSPMNPITGGEKIYKLVYSGKSVLLSPEQGKMFEAAFLSQSSGIAPGSPSISISGEVVRSNFDNMLAEGIKGYFGSAQFGYDVLSNVAIMFISDPYAKAIASIGAAALKMLLFPGTSPLGLALAVAGLVMTYFMMSCDAQDYQTVRLKRAGRCVRIGEFCIKEMPVIRFCLQWGVRYCCFNSKIARIIHEQGRPQLSTFGYSHSWGGPKKPNCRGFTPEEFQALDFGKIDFSEYIEDIEREVKSKFQQVEQDIYKKMEDTTRSRLPGGGN